MYQDRPDIDEYFLEICAVVSKRSTCRRRQFGAVIVKNGQVLSTGYNGAPKGMPHCTEIGCLRDRLGIASGTRHEICRAVHAEQNAIIQCAYHGTSTAGGSLYVNGKPCKICAKMILNAGIVRLVYNGDYPDEEGIELLEKAGLDVMYYDKTENSSEEISPGLS